MEPAQIASPPPPVHANHSQGRLINHAPRWLTSAMWPHLQSILSHMLFLPNLPTRTGARPARLQTWGQYKLLFLERLPDEDRC